MHKLDLAEPTLDVQTETEDNQAPVHSLEETPNMNKQTSKLLLVGILLAISAGVATGYGTHKLYFGSQGGSTMSSNQKIEQVAGDNIKEGDIFGSHDTSTFADVAQGYLEKGGVDGEGSHKLLREGGISQTVYLTSSVTDLDKMVGMEVKVWGETFKGQKAGWLMDVGRVEILNTQGEAPAE